MRWGLNQSDSEDQNFLFDMNSKTLDMGNKKATDMRGNKRVKVLEPIESDVKEIKMDNLKVKIHETYDQYILENCSKSGEILRNNDMKLSDGMKSIRKKIDSNELSVIPTDKTSKLSALPPDVYDAGMVEHTKGDKIISKKQLNKIENKLSDHSRSVVKIFRVGSNFHQEKRAVANATVQTNGQIPTLRGTDKDHKITKNDEVKLRSIVNTNDGPKKDSF